MQEERNDISKKAKLYSAQVWKAAVLFFLVICSVCAGITSRKSAAHMMYHSRASAAALDLSYLYSC